MYFDLIIINNNNYYYYKLFHLDRCLPCDISQNVKLCTFIKAYKLPSE